MKSVFDYINELDHEALTAETASEISDSANEGSLIAREFAHAIDADDPESLDPRTGEHREAFARYVAGAAWDRLGEAFDNLCAGVSLEGTKVRAWRELVVPDGWERDGIVGRPLGVCWAYDEDGAEAHWGNGFGQDGHARVVVEALVPADSVDWSRTAVLNAVEGDTVGEEKEIRLRDDALVEVVGMTRIDWKGKRTAIDVSHLAGMPLPAGSPEAAVHDPDYYEELHRLAGEETGFFGARGSGCIIVARSTGRILMPLRSDCVLEPGTYGTWGGALDPGLTPEQGARRELFQEAGYDGAAEFTPLLEFKPEGSTFRYQNFLAVVDEEFEPVLNHETDEATWMEFGDWPDPLHFGLAALLADPDSLRAIEEACRAAAPRPR